MDCPQCGTNNPADNNFCAHCGIALIAACAKCGAVSPPRSNFCGKCGAPLAAIGAETEARSRAGAGERRHLTALFCDLVDSTGIATQLDPEEWRELIAEYHRAATQAIQQFGGYVAQYLGDGVVAYFGWPQAHENDAERAARAGFELLHSIDRLNQEPVRIKLSARVGIHSGAVVVGVGAGGGDEIFGDVPNIAARVQAVTEPGTVLITDATHRLLAGRFEAEQRGPHNLKGIAQPQQLYLLKQQIQGRRAALAAGVRPFIGRREQLQLLLERWERARQGHTQVVCFVGEPGIGKSRLIREFQAQIADEPHVWTESAGDQFTQSTPFHAVSEMLRAQLVSSCPDGVEQSIERLASLLQTAGLPPRQTLPLIAPLLKLPVPQNCPPLPAAPEEQRRQLLSSLCRWAIGTARVQPMVLVLEDIQWADASTLEFAQLLATSGAEARLMQIYTARPGLDLSWMTGPNHAQLTLERLSDDEARAMVEGVTFDRGLSEETITTVVKRATGIPLFVEELTLDLLERGKEVRPGVIPASLHDLLTARLDRLGPARELAQIGAAIGREFSPELLRLVANVSERELQTVLDQLVGADLLHSGRSGPGNSYIFKHALIQDAAYGTLLKSRRRELHGRIAQILEERFPETARSAPELLAHHCTEAGLTATAVRYWHDAGMRAIEHSAHVEAIAHLRKGLELVNELPLTSERLTEEVKLQIALTTPLIATAGYTAPEVEKASTRALELCRQFGAGPQLFQALGSLQSIYFNRGDLEVAFELANQLLRLADTQQNPAMLLWADYALGFTLAWQGELKKARHYLERALARYERRVAGAYGFAQDPGPTALVQLAHVLHSLGYPQQALLRTQEATAEARKLSHPFTLAVVVAYAAGVHWNRGDKIAARKLWQEQVALCAEQGFSALLAAGLLRIGLAEVEDGRSDGALRKMDVALTKLTDSLAIDKPDGLCFLAVALARIGRVEQAVARIDEALTLATKTPKFVGLSRLYLTKGQLLLEKDPNGFRKARQCFSSAIEIASRQSAKSDELSATIQMARLLAHQGHRERARSMLKKIYNWFTEGFDTPDLKAAKALLDELKA